MNNHVSLTDKPRFSTTIPMYNSSLNYGRTLACKTRIIHAQWKWMKPSFCNTPGLTLLTISMELWWCDNTSAGPLRDLYHYSSLISRWLSNHMYIACMIIFQYKFKQSLKISTEGTLLRCKNLWVSDLWQITMLQKFNDLVDRESMNQCKWSGVRENAFWLI